MADASDLTPMEWLARLGKKLVDRQEAVKYWKRYYDGNHDLPAGPDQYIDAFRRFQMLARTNLCLLCAESMVHRMSVTGYRDGSNDRGTNPLWELWQKAKLDGRQFAVYRKAFSRSAAYVTVGIDKRAEKRPRVTIEGPENVIVETDPGDSSERLAALRLWHDSIVKKWMCTLYLPGKRYHWQTRNNYKTNDGNGTGLSWSESTWEDRANGPQNSFDVIPVIPFLNGDEGEDPVAEFDAGVDVQNRLNLTILNRLSSERYAAYRQRFMTNYETETDKVTGLPIAPYRPGVQHIWTAPPPEPGQPEVKFGDFAQTDTSQMLRGCEADMRAFAAVTLTPVYYLPGDLVNIGADSVAALDAGHVAKVRQRMVNFGEGWEEALSLMAQIAGVTGDFTSGEVVWARPENFNPAQVADYASKLFAAGFPLPMIAEEIGWSPQRVDALRSELAAAAFLAAASAPQPAPTPGQGAPTPRQPNTKPGVPPTTKPPVSL